MPATSAWIEVNELRVGMFVHLDVGWMSHPFPLSSFRITSDDQITTIRGLGLGRLRWSPGKSQAADADVGRAEPSPPVETPEQAERRAHREALAAQRALLLQCERQYAEAQRAWRAIVDLAPAQPEAARQQAEALTGALAAKMLGERELCIRVLTNASGEGPSAHGLNVGVVAMLMGKLFGLGPDEMLDLGVGALLHDIGKSALPDRVRFLDDGFSAAETALYREHVSHGVALGRRMGLSAGALLVIAQHHESADGSGFPQRLNIDRMTALARIVALVNRYDNLCNPPLPSRALTPHEAVSTMFAQCKHKFDATMLNAFIRMVGVYPPGSVVQLTDDRYAIVVTVNSSRPLKPRVLVHDATTPREHALYLDLEATPDIGIRRSVRGAQLPPASLAYLSPRQRVSYFFEPAPVRAEAPVTA